MPSPHIHGVWSGSTPTARDAIVPHEPASMVVRRNATGCAGRSASGRGFDNPHHCRSPITISPGVSHRETRIRVACRDGRDHQHDQRLGHVRCRARERGRRADLRCTRRGEPRHHRVASHVEHRTRSHPPRTGRCVHGRYLRTAHRPSRGVHQHPGTRCAEPGHGRGLRPPRSHADGHGDRPEGNQEQPAGPVPDRRHGGHHEAADEVLPTDRQRLQHPDDRARRLPHGR